MSRVSGRMYRCAAARDGAAACWRSASVGTAAARASSGALVAPCVSNLLYRHQQLASGAWPKGNSRVFTASQCDLSVSQDFARIDSLIFIWVEGGSGIGDLVQRHRATNTLYIGDSKQLVV